MRMYLRLNACVCILAHVYVYAGVSVHARPYESVRTCLGVSLRAGVRTCLRINGLIYLLIFSLSPCLHLQDAQRHAHKCAHTHMDTHAHQTNID